MPLDIYFMKDILVKERPVILLRCASSAPRKVKPYVITAKLSSLFGRKQITKTLVRSQLSLSLKSPSSTLPDAEGTDPTWPSSLQTCRSSQVDPGVTSAPCSAQDPVQQTPPKLPLLLHGHQNGLCHPLLCDLSSCLLSGPTLHSST